MAWISNMAAKLAGGIGVTASAQEQFDAVTFQESGGQHSIDELRVKTLAVFDANAVWYGNAANRRRYFSLALTWGAISLGGIGLIILELAAFDPKGGLAGEIAVWAKQTVSDFVARILQQQRLSSAVGASDISPAAVATMFLVIAGLFIFTDRVLLVSANMTRHRVTEFVIRSMRAEFTVEFIKAYIVEIADNSTQPDQRLVFSRMQVICATALQRLAEEIEEETKAWEARFNESQALLRNRFGKGADAQARAKEAALGARFGAVLVTVGKTAADGAVRSGNFSLHVEGGTPSLEAGITPGQSRAFSVPPGNWVVKLLNDQGSVVDSRIVQVKSDLITPQVTI